MKRVACLLMGGLLLLGCGSKDLDLTPLAGSAGVGVAGLCQPDQERLLVTIANRGKHHSLASTTIVRFGEGPEKVLPTQPVPPGGRVEVTLTLPPDCLEQDGCTFTVTADGRYDIPESNEDNNTYHGSCRP